MPPLRELPEPRAIVFGDVNELPQSVEQAASRLLRSGRTPIVKEIMVGTVDLDRHIEETLMNKGGVYQFNSQQGKAMSRADELNNLAERATNILEDAFNNLEELREELGDSTDETLLDDRIEQVQSQISDWKEVVKP